MPCIWVQLHTMDYNWSLEFRLEVICGYHILDSPIISIKLFKCNLIYFMYTCTPICIAANDIQRMGITIINYDRNMQSISKILYCGKSVNITLQVLMLVHWLWSLSIHFWNDFVDRLAVTCHIECPLTVSLTFFL